MTIPENYYDLVLVGQGYSIATYLSMAEFSWCKRIAIIGGTDSWASSIRGTGVINHSRNILAREISERHDLTILRNSLQPTREDLANTNAKIISDFRTNPPAGCTVNNIKSISTAISRENILLGRGETIERSMSGTTVLSRKAGDIVPFYRIAYKSITGSNIGALSTAATEEIFALKVIYGGGAGPQTPPMLKDTEWQAINIANPQKEAVVKYPADAKVMDLDTFMVRSGVDSDDPLNPGNIALVGPNAGIDGAMASMGNNDLNLFWLIRGAKGTKPAWLPSKHYKFTRNGKNYSGDEAIKYAEGRIINYKDIKVTKSGSPANPIQLMLSGAHYFSDNPFPGDTGIRPAIGGDNLNLDITYYVFAIGQNASLEERRFDGVKEQIIRIGPAKVLKPILDGESLTPVYDLNQRYGYWFETAVGLQDSYASPYQGLQVIGASALAMALRGAPVVKQNYLDNSQLGRNISAVLDSTQVGQDAKKFQHAMTVFGSSQLDREYYRLSDYFENNINVPSVANTMMNLVTKLNQRNVGAGDQLGAVRSQVATLTGYDLIAANAGKIALQVQIQQFIDIVLKNKNQLSVEGTKKAAYENINKAANSLYSEMTLKWSIAYGERNLWSELGIFFRDNMRTEMIALDNFIGSEYSADAATKMLQEIPNVLSNMYYLLAGLQTFVAKEAVDYNAMDRTEFAVFLAARYPQIKPEDWQSITNKIINGRTHRPAGYDAMAIRDINSQLELINIDSSKAGTFTAP